MPFSDLTSGTETYAAGRFSISIATPTGIYELDFNRAYHPVLLLQPDLRVSVSAARESPEDSDSRRREA